jgi:hypothetical protein
MKEVGHQAVIGMIRQLLKDNPELHCVAWTQYTPYFNDGDSCHFGIHEVAVGISDSATLEEFKYLKYNELCDEFDNVEASEGSSVKYVSNHNIRHSIKTPERLKRNGVLEIVKALETKLHHMEDICKVAFGDHCSVMITRDDIQIDETNHD